MAALLSVLCVVLAVMNSSAKIAAREFKVGGEMGWHEPSPNDTAFYNQWASTNRFQVGDSLGNHSFVYTLQIFHRIMFI